MNQINVFDTANLPEHWNDEYYSAVVYCKHVPRKGQEFDESVFKKIAVKLFEVNKISGIVSDICSEVNGYGFDHGYRMMIIALNHYKGTIVFGLRKTMTNGCYYVAPAINGKEYQGMLVKYQER